MILDYVTHYVESNTLEVRWVNCAGALGEQSGCTPVRTQAYSQDQAELLIADLGDDAHKYLIMAGWQ